ncbi:S8 family serine peptidase [Candidatus Dependentiae bacterium]|nr:S8 family serine peptidase [Candidatus Dependentiae bacterium]
MNKNIKIQKIIFSVFIIIIFSFITNCGTNSTNPDYTFYEINESEYNDNLFFSQNIGNYGINSIIKISGNIETVNDFDVYTFKILKPSKISLKLSYDDFQSPQRDFDFTVYREYVYLGSAESTIEPEEFTFVENLEYTEFAVKIYSYSETGNYDFEITISTSGYGSISGKLTPCLNYSPGSIQFNNSDNLKNNNIAPGKFLCKYKNNRIELSPKLTLAKKTPLSVENIADLKITASGERHIFNNIYSGKFEIASNQSCASGTKSYSIEYIRKKDFENNFREIITHSEKFTLKLIDTLKKSENIEYAEPDYIQKKCSVRNDIYFPFQWNLFNLNVPSSWNISSGSDTVIIAVIDTGLKFDHPEFTGKIVQGYDFISEPESGNDGDGIDPDPDDSGDAISSSGNSYHGTHIAGIIAANTNNSEGISGISYNCKIMPIRALGRYGGLTSDVMESVKFAAGLDNSSGIKPVIAAKIINMSFGSEFYSRAFEELLDTIDDMNITVVCAGGNENSQLNFYPAGYQQVISVAAVDYDNKKTFYSNYGSYIDICAPGGDMTVDLNKDNYPDGIISAFWNEPSNSPDYQVYQGTSQAAAHISGICGLILSVKPGISSAELKNILYSNALDLGDSGKDNYYGYGLADSYKCLVSASNSINSSAAKMILSSSKIDLYLPEDSAVIKIYNAGVDTLTITNITVSDSKCSAAVTKQTLPIEIKISVDKNNFSSAVDSYIMFAVISSNSGDDSITVIVHTDQLNRILTDEVYVLLMDPDNNFQTVKETSTDYFKNFEYSISNIPAGRYYLVAGTDKNSNNILGDAAGEYIGYYPLLTDRKKIVIEPNDKFSGLDFELFQTSRTASTANILNLNSSIKPGMCFRKMK